MKKPCWSCRDAGRGSWCQICKPMIDWFGCEIPEGRKGTWVQTYTGIQFWPRSPKPEDFAIEDIAIGLSREYRYGKQTIIDYTVAEHSVIVSLVAEDFAKATGEDPIAYGREGLLHDCDEGILPDMPRPLKHDPEFNMDSFRECGHLIQAAAFERFGIVSTPESHRVIDMLDKRLVMDEVLVCMRHPAMYLERHPNVHPLNVKIQGLAGPAALELFLSRFAELWPDELRE